MKYRVIYIWSGERYQHSRQPETLEEANQLVDELRAEGWTAWHERV